jgi:hypothetical protein
LIATAAILGAGSGTVWAGYEYGFKSIMKAPVESPIKYDYKSESLRKNSYTIEQVALPINLPNTNKDFIKIKLETGKILRVKKRGEKITKPIFMYEAKDSNGKYIDKNSNEYYLTKNLDNTYNILNEQRMGGAN